MTREVTDAAVQAWNGPGGRLVSMVKAPVAVTRHLAYSAALGNTCHLLSNVGIN